MINQVNAVALPSALNEDILERKALEALRKNFGYSNFRSGQWKSILNVLRGNDTIVLMPTGGGKSICFQIPALMAEGCCIVVSPLIALMSDQVRALQANGVAAGAINSLQTTQENNAVYQRAKNGDLKLLYISPETLLLSMEWLSRNVNVSLFAIDEAHCISQWGHDFRPVYTDLARIRESWKATPIMALTATADRVTREDIGRALHLNSPMTHVGSFDRPNLSLKVVQGAKLSERLHAISQLIDRYPLDCGIVYCLSRKKSEKMAEELAKRGYKAVCYHAGMSAEERDTSLRKFVAGKVQAVCATIAFGMGIDKSNIRWVVHNNIPGNIESYYQEIGRAGRDGLPAETILFYSYSDIITRRSFAESSGRKELNEQKLEFMQKYAEADVCRRRILLSYFSEEAIDDCGNCDNCRNPRKKIDGTEMAQKALSASIRINGGEGINGIVEILRGMRRQYLIEKGYDKLPTYGVGAGISGDAWFAYIMQMVQLGLFEVAYDDHFHLRPTPLGWKVVRGEKCIQLAEYRRDFDASDKRRSKKDASREKVLTPEEKLLVGLKLERAKLAEECNVADYMIASDATLADMVAKKPISIEELFDIEGMSLVKVAKYYKPFLAAIRKVKEGTRSLGRGTSEALSRGLFKRGMSLPEIAAVRQIGQSTIMGHLADSFAMGYDVDLERAFPLKLFLTIRNKINSLSPRREEDAAANAAARKKFEEEAEVNYGFTPGDIKNAVALMARVDVSNGAYIPKTPTHKDC